MGKTWEVTIERNALCEPWVGPGFNLIDPVVATAHFGYGGLVESNCEVQLSIRETNRRLSEGEWKNLIVWAEQIPENEPGAPSKIIFEEQWSTYAFGIRLHWTRILRVWNRS